MMNEYDSNACMSAFSQLCDEADRSELVSAEECQYWVFERGYKAAMDAMIKMIDESKTEQLPLPIARPIANKLALH